MAEIQHSVLDESVARSYVPRREADVHKWSIGGVVVIAGSPVYPGTTILACRAAGRAGAGIVRLATSRGVVSTVAGGIPEVGFIPLGETESSSGARHAVESIREGSDRAAAMVVGPGLGVDEASDGLLSALFGFGSKADTARNRMGFGIDAAPAKLSETANTSIFTEGEINVVIDADALTWLSKQPEWWTRVPVQRIVLTPHPGEMSRLLDIPIEEVKADPVRIATEAAAKWQQVVFLKGEKAVVSDGETTYVADISTPSLATAGSGDVLAGTIGGLLAQIRSPLEAALLGAWVGPRAALRLEERFGVLGLIATDLPDAIAHELALLAS
jgi:ADP-dependent NAD(P)H-hydrate dehydratase / NAD(P)H-hydrate epimerase